MALSTNRLRFAMADNVVEGARIAMEQAKRDVISNLAGHERTGGMKRSVHFRVRPNINSVTVTLSVDNPGASFLDLGTSTPITSPSGGRMAVFAREGGDVQPRTQVRGQPATRFFSKVADDLAQRVAREVGRKR